MNTLDAETTSTAKLPILDISGLGSADPRDRRRVGRELREACSDRGFFYAVGHGVDAALRDEVFAMARAFFALPLHEKLAIDVAGSVGNRGYEPMRGQRLEAGSPPDLKEGFRIGRELTPDDPRVVARKWNCGWNLWPDRPTGFREALEAYYAQMLPLARRVVSGLALALELPEDRFDSFCQEETATLRLLHYPPQPENALPGEKGCGEHTDWGAITFLMQDDCGGLQVRDADGAWIHATPLPEAFVVNLGDLTARWTNDRFRSTHHRVVNASGRERYSVPFFYDGNPDEPIECISSCLGPGERPRYAPTTPAEHLLEKYRAAQAS